MIGIDNPDPRFFIPAAIILWLVYVVIRLRERKLRRDREVQR